MRDQRSFRGSLYNISKLLDTPAMLDWIQWILSLGKQCNKKWLRKLMKPNDQDFVLDVGCGTGRYAEIFNCIYFGVDSNKDYISFARKKHKGRFLTMDATSLAFPDSMFQYIFGVGLLHHMGDDEVTRAIREMKRVCRPGGRIVIIEPIYPTNKLNIIGYVLCRFDRGRFVRRPKDLMRILSADSSSFNYTIEKCFPFEDILISGVNN